MTRPPYPAPDFKLNDENGQPYRLADYKNKWLVLYFYPKDDTPGCTVEACSLRDAHDDISILSCNVVGISKDDAFSHERFKAKHSLNFTLLSDPTGKTIETYGAWGKKMFGKEGIQRKTFLINPQGEVVKVWGKVTPIGHGEQVLSELRAQKKVAGGYGSGAF